MKPLLGDILPGAVCFTWECGAPAGADGFCDYCRTEIWAERCSNDDGRVAYCRGLCRSCYMRQWRSEESPKQRQARLKTEAARRRAARADPAYREAENKRRRERKERNKSQLATAV